jgi:AraC family transcriptional regulator
MATNVIQMTGKAPSDEAALWVLEGLQSMVDRLETNGSPTTVAILQKARQLLGRAYTPDAAPTRPQILLGGLAQWQIRALTRHIDGHLDNKLTLRGLAEIVRLSPSYLCRAFRTSLGCSPMHFVRQRRVAAAKQMMRESDLPLCELALRCGFADQAHFTRIFRATTGDTPRRWRHQWQGLESPAGSHSAAA